jgi:hypothetical protein
VTPKKKQKNKRTAARRPNFFLFHKLPAMTFGAWCMQAGSRVGRRKQAIKKVEIEIHLPPREIRPADKIIE